MINHNHDADPGNGVVPPFAAIEHPGLPVWMLEGLDRMFALEPRITKIHFDLWAHSYYDDNTNYEFKGSATFNTVAGVTEDDLDEVAPVRMFERRADELWEIVPLTIEESETVSINGEYEFYAERGRILFEYRTMNELEHVMRLEIVHDGTAWTIDESIAVPNHEGSASDLLAADPDKVLAVYSESDLMLDKMPEATGVEMDEEERVVFHLKPGELTRCMETR